ncbi:hypothetical protein O5625_25360, partial [Escherichia coli]|nr:hypothetical protein [Escherichia coli]
MLLTRMTRVVNVDIWNIWHMTFTGALPLLLPVILLTGCSSSPTISPGGVNTPPPDINAWLKPRSEKPDSLSETRWKMLTDAGKT